MPVQPAMGPSEIEHTDPDGNRLRIAHSTRRLTVICGSLLHAQCRTAGSVVTAMTWDVERAYREHLTPGDLALLSDVVGGQPLVGALSSPGLEQIVFGLDPQFDPSRSASPFLSFAVAVHRVAERLTVTTYVDEWIGPRQRVPV